MELETITFHAIEPKDWPREIAGPAMTWLSGKREFIYPADLPLADVFRGAAKMVEHEGRP